MTNSFPNAIKIVHYISAKCDDASKLGAVKLNKILWYADIAAYITLGRQITELRYIKQPRGPVPNNIREILKMAEGEDLIRVSKADGSPKAMLLVQSQKEPDMNQFSEAEMNILDSVIQQIRDNHTGTSISEETHSNWAWKIANIGEEIPLETSLLGDAVLPDDRDIKWADAALSRREQSAK